jgi:hypothetical protein
MGWLDDLRAAAAWVEEQWDDLPESTRRQVLEVLGRASTPSFYIDLALVEINARLTELRGRLETYVRHPDRLRGEFIDYIMPGSRYGELARLLTPGSEPVEGYGEEIRRPVILVPGMVGTRLFRTGEGSSASSASLPPDQLQDWMERQFRSVDSDFLRGLPDSVREVLAPALTRISDRHLYNPRTVWDPDSPYAMVDLMNKTATERGALFCPDDTPAEPAADFATEVAESMTLGGLIQLWYGSSSARRAREIAAALGADGPDGILEDAGLEALRERRQARGWCHPVWQVSKDWLLPLERAFGEVIYAFGYDWRQPLEQSAVLLAQKIERVKRHHDGLSVRVFL